MSLLTTPPTLGWQQGAVRYIVGSYSGGVSEGRVAEDVRSLPIDGVYIWRVDKKILGRAVYRFAALEENNRVP